MDADQLTTEDLVARLPMPLMAIAMTCKMTRQRTRKTMTKEKKMTQCATIASRHARTKISVTFLTGSRSMWLLDTWAAGLDVEDEEICHEITASVQNEVSAFYSHANATEKGVRIDRKVHNHNSSPRSS